MSSKLISYLFVLAGILNIVNAIVFFVHARAAWGAVYLFLGIVMLGLSVFYRKKLKKKS